jgi:phosphate transport system protein
MVATTRSVFDHQLNVLRDNVLHLSELVVAQVQQAIQALRDRDMALARRVDVFDATINRMRYEIEEQCYTLLALQQPNSHDMRSLVATVSVVTNLERMGDHAAGIARLVLRMDGMACYIPVGEFDQMADAAAANLRDAMTALATEDKILARAVASRDAEIDELHKAVYDRLIRHMVEDTSSVECATMMLWISHNLERYADRISNICERIMYVITGELVKQRADQMP